MNLTEKEFWKSIFILLRNQHVIQKKLAGVSIIGYYKIEINANVNIENICENDIEYYLDSNNVQKYAFTSKDDIQIFENMLNMENLSGIVIVSNFIMKNSKQQSIIGYQLLDFSTKIYYCKMSTKDSTLHDYHIKFDSNNLKIHVQNESEKLQLNDNWCNYFFKPKLLKWARNEINSNKQSTQSLCLIDLEKYTNLYNELKIKYAKNIIDIWPESTDPLKFVHEDVAIAAYLITLWTQNKTEPKKNFVDLGCGNGLLVYILNSEGYPGYGLDVRRRKIWNNFPNSKLLEHTVVPNDFNYSYDADWMIGNHSDELSPWIPVIAAKSSYNCKFFLLPCCGFEFSGEKFQRRNSKSSSYNDFLEYLTLIVTEKCEFEMLQDRLKIPSTKRIAVIGISRKYEERDFMNKCNELQTFVDNEISCSTIKLRSKIEIVQNCTQLDKNVKENLILIIFNFILHQNDSRSSCDWNEGGQLTLEDIAQHLKSSDLNAIKDQCGGLKTLLKNHHEIFQIHGNLVRLRKPQKKIQDKKYISKRDCFFNIHHPNGCPLNSKYCSFIHKS